METLQISLAAARKNAELTQADVARIMHVSKQTVVNWEKGKTTLNIAEIEMLCQIFKISRDYIFLPKS